MLVYFDVRLAIALVNVKIRNYLLEQNCI